MMVSFSQTKIIFLTKNTTLRPQPLNAEIIQSFKVWYRKRLVKYVLARINDKSSTTQIIEDVDMRATVKNCFGKLGIVKNEDLMEVEEVELREFKALLLELRADIPVSPISHM